MLLANTSDFAGRVFQTVFTVDNQPTGEPGDIDHVFRVMGSHEPINPEALDFVEVKGNALVQYHADRDAKLAK